MEEVNLNSTSFAEKIINSNCSDEMKVYNINVELLKNIKHLERESEEQHNLIDDQNQEIQFLNNRNADLKKSNQLAVNNREQLDQKINKLNQENVSLRLETTVYGRKAEILNENIEHLRKCCDELQEEITELRPQIDKINTKVNKKPIDSSPAYCCLDDPVCPNFGKELISSREEKQENEKEVEEKRRQMELKVLSVFKYLRDAKETSFIQSERRLLEVDNKLAIKWEYQQSLILKIEEKRKLNELTTNLWDEIQEEERLCKNCCPQIECSCISSMSFAEFSDLVELELSQSSNSTLVRQRCCTHMPFSKLYLYLCKKFKLSNQMDWTDLAEAASICAMYGGNFYLNGNEKFPSDCIK